MSITIENKEEIIPEITMGEDVAVGAGEVKEEVADVASVSAVGGKKKVEKGAMEKFEEKMFGGIAGKLKLVAKILLYIFMGLSAVGVVLTMLLTSSLGGFGVIVALLLVGIFMFVGYSLSALIYAYSNIVENSAKPRVDFDQVVLHDSVVNQTTHVEKVDIDIDIDDEFPEF